MSRSTEQMVEEVERLRVILVGRATNGDPSNDEYVQLRSEIMRNPSLKPHVPQCVRTCSTLEEFWHFIQPMFPKYKQRREYLQAEFKPLLEVIEQAGIAPSDDAISDMLASVDWDHVQQAWHKALERRETDPQGAITASRTLLETVMKHILDDASVEYDENSELPKLYRLLAEELELSPSQQTENAFRQVLGGCQAVVEGLGAIRNRLGDAHGGGRSNVRPSARHAELAVNLAGAMATFLVSTWQERNS